MPDPSASHPQHKTSVWRRLIDAQIERAEAWNARVQALGDFALEGGAASLETGARVWRESLGGAQDLQRRCWSTALRLLGRQTATKPGTPRPTITIKA
jgi:hypothetical protein